MKIWYTWCRLYSKCGSSHFNSFKWTTANMLMCFFVCVRVCVWLLILCYFFREDWSNWWCVLAICLWLSDSSFQFHLLILHFRDFFFVELSLFFLITVLASEFLCLFCLCSVWSLFLTQINPSITLVLVLQEWVENLHKKDLYTKEGEVPITLFSSYALSNLHQSTNCLKHLHFRTCIAVDLPSRHLWFFSFHTVPNTEDGIVLHILSSLFLVSSTA